MSKRSEKTNFTKALALQLGISQNAAKQAVDGVFALLADELRTEGQVSIWGVGCFELLDVEVPTHWQTPRAGVVTQRLSPKVIRLRPARVFRSRIG